MQKILRRTAQVHRQAERKATRRAAYEEKGKQVEAIQQRIQHIRIHGGFKRRERKTRREDWMLGPLAPRRDIGEDAKAYGAVPAELTRSWDKRKPKDYGIFEGDRVVVTLKGHRDRGRIGTVTTVEHDKETCIVEGMNIADVVIPDYMLAKETDKTPFRPFTLPIPLWGVKLVAKLINPETGIDRDVVINRLDVVKTKTEWGEEKIERFISSLEPRTEIPLPPEQEENHSENKGDTWRIDVEQKTFTEDSDLRMYPMPNSIIDELRNKYSKFRTRHDPEWIAKKEQQERERREKQALIELKGLSPMAELKLKQQAEKKALPKPELSDEMLAKIGEIIEKNTATNQRPPQVKSEEVVQ